MCGIVGAVSTRNIVPILVQGLQRLEYRGYDSCGVAVHEASMASTRQAACGAPAARRAWPSCWSRWRRTTCRAPPASPTRAGPRMVRPRCTTPTRISATAPAGEAPDPDGAPAAGPGAQRHHRKP